MEVKTEPYTLEIRAGSGSSVLTVLQGLLVMCLGPLVFFAAAKGEVAQGVAFIGLVPFVLGGYWAGSEIVRARNGTPAFHGDRTGFRIRGGRLRAWHEMLNTDVKFRKSEYGARSATLRIRRSYDSMINWDEVATCMNTGRVENLANDLILFKVKMEKLRDRDAVLMVGAAPVVAARGHDAHAQHTTLAHRLGRWFGQRLRLR